jgi:phosphatidylserine synthase
MGWGPPFTGYVVLQATLLCVLRGKYRVFAGIPLPFMAWVAWYTFEAYQAESNLWPIVMIITSPFAIIYLLIVAALSINSISVERAKALKVAVALICTYIFVAEIAWIV